MTVLWTLDRIAAKTWPLLIVGGLGLLQLARKVEQR